MENIRTRFAPSPTGYLHIGGARTALFAWAFARRTGGRFLLRIEDTDVERSTQASVDAILDSMRWLGLDYDEGPYYQSERMPRYREVIQRLLDEGKAYRCYASKSDLEALRETQRAQGLKPRYDGRWRDPRAAPPKDVDPVVRFKNPLAGEVVFDDLIKGRIAVDNKELDDLVIARADGTPTYNFCVVVDDYDMNITHVIRGDDHVNNTPRQINILTALGASIPCYAHVPMILGGDGERLSKRHGAVGVMQYRDEGYLPQALLNYLARLGWAHGDAEIFSIAQFVEWFGLAAVNNSPARFDFEKLLWVNQQHLKAMNDAELAQLVAPLMEQDGIDLATQPALFDVIALLKERNQTLRQLARSASWFYRAPQAPEEIRREYFTGDIKPSIMALREKLGATEWSREAISKALKSVASEYDLKFPQLAMPLRAIVAGQTQTPAIDATLHVLGKDSVLNRIDAQLRQFPP
ncbi:MAG: glutamate--tRNA ligase [Pseudomonadota bacterium]|nr:glutamate--tRNA ligase [Burkholderiales bacterium]MDQ3195849.1 glutamate--tRNA ligase [Pseudomonadota bacterium]